MSKIKIKTQLITPDEKIEYVTNAILESNKILKYKENDDNKTTVTFNYENKILKRENDNIYLEYEFNKDKVTKGTIISKELGYELYVNIKTNGIILDKNNIYIEYCIEEKVYKYKIEVI